MTKLTREQTQKIVESAFGFVDKNKQFFTVFLEDSENFQLVADDGPWTRYSVEGVTVNGASITFFDTEAQCFETFTQVAPVTR
jgi:hypothetical protein